MSNIVFFGFIFWFHLSEYLHQKGFIPLLRVSSFFKKQQVVIKFLYLQNKDNFRSQPYSMNILLDCLLRGKRKRTKKHWLNPPEYFYQKNLFVFPLLNPCKHEQLKDQTKSNKKVTFNEHPKLNQKGFQEKVKQTKEKMIGSQGSVDCFKKHYNWKESANSYYPKLIFLMESFLD